MPNHHGDDWKSPAHHAQQEERVRRAIQMKITGMTLDQISKAALDDDGQRIWTTPQGVWAAISYYRTRQQREANEGLETLRAEANERLDLLRRQIYPLVFKNYWTFHNGRPVRDEDGNMVPDIGPKLAALDRALKLEERAAKINGTDASETLKIALERRTDLEADVSARAILAGFDAAGLEPAQRMLALEAAQSYLRTVDGEVISEQTSEE